MKTRIRICIAAMTLSILLAFAFAGCSNKSGNTIDESEITADYLIEDYSQQLITDGGENMLGHVTMEKTGDTYAVHFSEREVVPSTEYKEGYYIADTNVTVDGTLGLDARFVCLHDGEAEVSNADDFIKHQNDDSERLYSVYFLGTSAELIIEVEPESVIAE